MGLDIAPRVRITVKGKALDLNDLVSVTVRDKIKENDEFEFTVYNRDRKYKGAFEKAQDIQIYFGYGDKLKKLIAGATDEVRYRGSSQGETVDVRGTSAGLADNIQTPESKTWENTNLKEIAQKITGKMGWKVNDLTKGLKLHEVKIEQTQQLNESDLRFFNRLAKEYGLELQVKDGELVVRDPADETSSPVDTFTWGKNIISYEVVEKSKDVYNVVGATDYDEKNKKTITDKQEGKPGWTENANNTTTKNIPAKDQKDLKQKNEAQNKKLNSEEKTLRLTVLGQNYYRAGATVKVVNVEHPGKWYSNIVVHRYSKSGYQCDIEASNKQD